MVVGLIGQASETVKVEEEGSPLSTQCRVHKLEKLVHQIIPTPLLVRVEVLVVRYAGLTIDLREKRKVKENQDIVPRKFGELDTRHTACISREVTNKNWASVCLYQLYGFSQPVIRQEVIISRFFGDEEAGTTESLEVHAEFQESFPVLKGQLL